MFNHLFNVIVIIKTQFFLIKSLKSKEKEAGTNFVLLSQLRNKVEQSKKFIYIDQSTFSHIRENSKMFNITSKYVNFFNNKPRASWVADVTQVIFLLLFPARIIVRCWNTRYFCGVSISRNIRKAFFWENIRNFLILEPERFISEI